MQTRRREAEWDDSVTKTVQRPIFNIVPIVKFWASFAESVVFQPSCMSCQNEAQFTYIKLSKTLYVQHGVLKGTCIR